MKKISAVLVLMVVLCLLCGCGGYGGNYSASMLTSSCQGGNANVEFESFTGTYTFRLKVKDDIGHTLDYEASLAEGDMNVYIGINGEKELLFTVTGGESCEDTIALSDKYDHEEIVHIILESADKCTDGKFEFEYN
ncbi:MAG: hypothetical protein HUJ73_06855 [Eubacterium sp.]|nr:hypothetical protein [Eubacterium sp.]